MTTKKILVVDDNLGFLKFMRRFFNKSDHMIITTQQSEFRRNIKRRYLKKGQSADH